MDEGQPSPWPRTKVLVTGATGFIGSHLARALAERGALVVAVGRNPYRTARIRHPNIRIATVDIRDAGALAREVEQAELVYHAAALSSPWGARSAFMSINVDGTRHVVDACLRHGIRRLVHVSSTSILFGYKDKRDLPDDAPLPETFCCDYAESKALAEGVVRGAVSERGLNAVIVRARAVIGPGDTAILPRLLAAAQRGRLPQIGDGENTVDLTFVDNLVHALLLAAWRGERGGAYAVTNGEPVKLWTVIRRVLKEAGHDAPLRPVPYRLVDLAARFNERVHRLLPSLGEPRITRYGAGILAKEQTYCIDAAARDLGYAPQVPLEEGLRRTIAALTARSCEPTRRTVELRLFSAGHTVAHHHHLLRGAPRERILIHSMFAMLQHPEHGRLLYDTGYDEAFVRATRGLPGCIYGAITPPTLSPQGGTRGVLEHHGIDPRSIQRVVLSHFHGDHVAGVHHFPHADVIAGERAWRSVEGRGPWRALLRAHLPGLLPPDFRRQLHLIEHFQDPGLGSFAHTHDLYGDGTVRLVDLSGHAAGQLGLLASTQRGYVLLLGDASWTTEGVRRNVMPHRVTLAICDDAAAQRETLRRLHQLHQTFPEIELLPSHCPEVARRYRVHWTEGHRD